MSTTDDNGGDDERSRPSSFLGSLHFLDDVGPRLARLILEAEASTPTLVEAEAVEPLMVSATILVSVFPVLVEVLRPALDGLCEFLFDAALKPVENLLPAGRSLGKAKTGRSRQACTKLQHNTQNGSLRGGALDGVLDPGSLVVGHEDLEDAVIVQDHLLLGRR